jgi:Uma2 family endonuclease
MSTASKARLSPEEYLKQERKAAFKSEYLDGEVFAMSGASRRHVLIAKNVTVALDQRLRGQSCETYGSDMRVRVSASGLYTYPDVTVTYGDEQFLDEEVDTLLNPLLIVEVLSPSTKNYDRGDKFASYRTIPSLREYVTIAQDRMHVEHWQQGKNERWMLSEYFNVTGSLQLTALGIELPLAEIYRRVFPEP